jgi:hypothetical protein
VVFWAFGMLIHFESHKWVREFMRHFLGPVARVFRLRIAFANGPLLSYVGASITLDSRCVGDGMAWASGE